MGLGFAQGDTVAAYCAVAPLESGPLHLTRLGSFHVHDRGDMDPKANTASVAEAADSAEAAREAIHAAATS